MRFYCTDCEKYFDEDEIDYRQEYMGEFWGTPAYDTFAYCPHCGGDGIVSEEDDEFPEEDEDVYDA